MTRKIYVAGPMRGYAHYNFDAFDAAAYMLRADGWAAISPTELDRVYEGWGQHPPEDFVVTPEFKRRCIERDLKAILECDAVYLLHGWEESEGTAAELALAVFLDLEIIKETDGSIN